MPEGFSFVNLRIASFYAFALRRAGWCLYFMLLAIYKIYYYLFKGIAIGCKKLYRFIKGKIATAETETPADPEQ